MRDLPAPHCARATSYQPQPYTGLGQQGALQGGMSTFAPGPDRVTELRRAFGCFGTGVTVITTQTPHGPLGMTANSFSSVSLDPPLVLWAPGKSSKRHDAFAQADHFCIHVLGADQLDLAQHFAKQGHDFDCFEWNNGPGGTPTLSGCLASFHCAAYAAHDAGDHSLVLGRVLLAATCHEPATGLIFHQGQFGQICQDT